MNRLSMLALAVCATASVALGQVNDVAPNDHAAQALKGMSRTLGDVRWSLDLENGWGDVRTLGVEFDGTNYWVTSAFDMAIAYLYKVAPNGTILNTYNQPGSNWGFWGWRDLAWDGTYLYAGDDSTKNGYITQINPTNGQPTGINYGPVKTATGAFQLVRALAYDKLSDTFYTANWGSEIHQVTRTNVDTIVSAPTGYSCYGMAMDESNPAKPMLWLWTYDSTLTNSDIIAHEWDPVTMMFTGKWFSPDPLVYGGICGGACAYPTIGGAWELCGMSQVFGSSGDLHGYEVGPETWKNLGKGLPGTTTPVLVGIGDLSPNTQVKLTLGKALPNSVAALIIGVAAVNLPLFGGTLVPSTNIMLFGLPTGPNGEIPISYTMGPAPVPTGVPIYLQYWVADPGGPAGYSASNGVTVTTP